MDIKQFKREANIDSAVEMEAFIKKHKEDFRKTFPKDLEALDKKKYSIFDFLNDFVEDARITGIEGSKIYKILKEDFKLNYKDLDKVLSVLKEKLIPEDEESEIVDLELKKRQKYIQQIIATVQAEQEGEIKQAA